MLGTCPIMAFSATTDAAASKNFYQDVLGLKLLADTPFALVFDAAGTELRVQKAPQHTPAPHTLLGWSVPAIGAAVTALLEKGVTFRRYDFLEQDESGVWTTPDGAKIAWFEDPDGNVLSLTQRAPA